MEGISEKLPMGHLAKAGCGGGASLAKHGYRPDGFLLRLHDIVQVLQLLSYTECMNILLRI